MMESYLMELLRDIPNEVGVYFIYDSSDRLIYIGKSIHLKKRLIQHFRSTDYRELKIQREASRIAYELMGDETIALLHESDLIKLHLPKYNRAGRKTKYTYGLYTQVNEDGYKQLLVEKIEPTKDEIMSFISYAEGKERLFAITERYKLCQKINLLYKSKGPCFQYQLKGCNGGCIRQEEVEIYNSRVNSFIEASELPLGEVFIQVKGRHDSEKGIIYIKDGTYKGFGYCKINTRSKNTFLKAINLKNDNRDTRRIIKRHLLTKNIT